MRLEIGVFTDNVFADMMRGDIGVAAMRGAVVVQSDEHRMTS